MGLVLAALWWLHGLAMADLIPPQAEAAAKRLQDRPRSFDRADNFCLNKKPGAACTIAGSHLAEGGEGVCDNRINTSLGSIDLVCLRTAEVEIDRGLPEGGFVADKVLCDPADRLAWEGKQPWNCKPLQPRPADRFCQGKAVGASCTVSLRYQGQPEQHEGICRTVTEEQRYYYAGNRVRSREVIRCESAEEPAQRSWHDATWWQKLWQ